MLGTAPLGTIVLGGWLDAPASPAAPPSAVLALLTDPLRFAPMITAPYGRAHTHYLPPLRDATTGQIKTNVALSAGDATISIDGAAFTSIGVTLPAVANGQWAWPATAGNHTGKRVKLRIQNAAYLGAEYDFVTIGDFRSGAPLAGQVHSSAITGVPTTAGCTLTTPFAAPPDAALVVELLDAAGVVVGARACSIAGAAVTFGYAFASVPATAVLAHVYAVAKDRPLSEETLGTVTNVTTVATVTALASTERTAIGTAVWATTTRTLTSFGTLVADVVAGVWGAASRTLSAFGTLAADIATAVAVKAEIVELRNDAEAARAAAVAAQNALAAGVALTSVARDTLLDELLARLGTDDVWEEATPSGATAVTKQVSTTLNGVAGSRAIKYITQDGQTRVGGVGAFTPS